MSKTQPHFIKQFLRQPTYAFALFFIILCLILSLFTFLFTADKTPEINEQIPSIGLKNPGFSVTLLLQKTSKPVTSSNRFKKLFFGSQSEYVYIPVSSYQIKSDSIYYNLYEENGASENKTLHLGELKYGSDYQGVTLSNPDSLNFQLADGRQMQTSRIDLMNDINSNHIKQRTYWLGTDLFGRSLLDRMLLGIRFSIFIGLLAVLISITIGTLIGLIAGYFGGRIDDVLSYIMNVFWSIPTLILVFAIVLVTGRGIQNIFLAVGLTMWVDAARLVRGQVLSLKKEKYVESAKAMGLPDFRIMTRHILPNMLGPLIVIAVSNFASAIIVESGLSYLGFGIQPPAPSLGSILSENYGFILTGKPFLAIAPILVLLLLVLSFNLVGNKVRDIFDIKSDLQP